ncbi:hypothetical protein AOLI_G00052860 [Acnodon oligacanthus]
MVLLLPGGETGTETQASSVMCAVQDIHHSTRSSGEVQLSQHYTRTLVPMLLLHFLRSHHPKTFSRRQSPERDQ